MVAGFLTLRARLALLVLVAFGPAFGLAIYGYHEALRHLAPDAHVFGALAAAALLGLATMWLIGERLVLRRIEAQLVRQSLYDTLTGLPNRALFMDRLAHEVAGSRRRMRGLAVLFTDLDRFKQVNDSLGHEAGDTVLQGVAARIGGSLRAGDTLARFGDDEFVALIEISHSSDAVYVADRILSELRAPFTVKGREVYISASVGVALALARHSQTTAEDLVRDADIALTRAKGSGKACTVLFDPSMSAGVLEQLDLEADLHRALLRGELRLEYQPEVKLSTGELVGMEALLRWDHPRRGLVSPGEFIPMAEETGLILPIGRWGVEEACHQMQSWRSDYPNAANVVLSVNLSAGEFQQHDLVEQITGVLQSTGLPPHCLRLEITETTLMDDAPATEARLEALRALGVRLAVDDFGTGYASLSYLQKFPVDTLKIDRSFVAALDRNPDAEAIVSAVITLGHALGMVVTAEGVETADHLALLRAAGCDAGQGYLFAPALSTEAMSAVLASGTLPTTSPRKTEVA